MNGNIKGIIVEIGGDTSGLQKALNEVNKVSNSLSKELRGINSLLKFNPKNTELLAQKQTVLADKIQATTMELNSLKHMQEEYDKQGLDKNSEKYRYLQREIIKTENELKQLKIEASSWTKASRSLDQLSKKFNKLGQSFTNVGKKLTTSVTVPIVSSGVLSVKSATEFESAFKGVEKTVDGTAEQMETLKKGIRDMAKEIPSTTTEISAVAEAAGQLGIATDDIIEFTRVMIDLGNSTNLGTDEAASALAKFANVTKMSAEDYDKLGSTIVDLGNNFATTEADIVHMATRLAAAGELAGLSEADILALSTAMSSVGINAEAGGTAMSKFLNKMQAAVERGPTAVKNFNKIFGKFGYTVDDVGKKVAFGGKELNELSKKVGISSKEIRQIYKETTKSAGALDDFAKVAGMSSAEFAKAFQDDAVSALSAFITGLNDVERNGKTAGLILDDMGIKEVRMRNTLLSLANANGVMTNAINRGRSAWDENNALTNEASKRYQTFQSKLTTTKNKINDLGISFGNILLPYVEKVVDKISELTEKFENLSPETQKTIIKIAAIAAAIGPVLLVIGKLLTAAGTILSVGSKIAEMIGILSGGASGLGAVITVITGPIGLAIAAGVALVAMLIHLWNTSESFRASVQDLGNQFVDTWNNTIKPTIDELWNGVLKPLLSYITTIWGPSFEMAFNLVAGTVLMVVNRFSNYIKMITGILSGLIKFITGVFKGDWKQAWEGVKQIFGSVFDGLKNMFKTPINWIIDRLNDFINQLNKIKIPDWVPEVGGKGFHIEPLNRLATGGIVTGPTLSLIGEGRDPEAVIPLNEKLTSYFAKALEKLNSLGQRTVILNFYPQKMTEEELDRAYNYVNRKFGMEY